MTYGLLGILFMQGYLAKLRAAALFSSLGAFICCTKQPYVADKDKIPMRAAYWYQLNTAGEQTTATTGLPQLHDGIVDEEVFMGRGKLLPTYDSYYEFKDLSKVYINKIRFYDGPGSFADQPFRLYAKASAAAPATLLATFTGEAAGQWVEVKLPAPVPARYLVARAAHGFPTELEVCGTYQAGKPIRLAPKKAISLRNECGVNSFVWDFLENSETPALRDRIYEPSMALLQAFSQYRDYVDWEKIETTRGVFAFNPTMSGGWNYDLLYQRLQQEGKEALPCLKTLPDWLLESYYPDGQRDSENVPAAHDADLLRPASYVLQAKLAFQFAARYGHNKKIDPALLAGVLTGPIYPTAPEVGSRTREVGLGYLHYIECENERDKWWKGRKAYQTAREYAANLSAFYDGHKHTLGPGVGVKTADPTMQVVMGGTATSQPDYVRGIIDWCKEYRGYKADGTVDLCFDVINYHCYANAAGGSQSSSSARGAAPEVAGIGAYADAFVQLGREYDKEVWVTEAGYDVNAGSPLHAPAIGRKTPPLVQADWVLRTALLYARHGISRLFLYQTYDLQPTSGGQFSSSGLLDNSSTTHQRKPAADYLYQVQHQLGAYVYQETISTNPLVDRYEWRGRSLYALMMPTERGQTATYSLPVPKTGTTTLYTPQAGHDSLAVQTLANATGMLKLTVTETPIFALLPALPARPRPH